MKTEFGLYNVVLVYQGIYLVKDWVNQLIQQLKGLSVYNCCVINMKKGFRFNKDITEWKPSDNFKEMTLLLESKFPKEKILSTVI